jgi:processive 1,2-diacylglycerol beta-glucosyltransferase
MRWLLLTSSTGTGHNMRADSLTRWAQATLGNAVELRTHHALEDTHRVYRFGVGLYNVIQRRAPWFHHVYFNYLELAGMHRRGSRILGRERFTQLVRDYRPHRIISVHAHTNHGFFDLAREAASAAGFAPHACVTYCGELFAGYGFSRHWTNPRADGFIGASAEVCAAARAVGTPPEKILHGGFLLRPPFYQTPAALDSAAAALAAELRLDPTAFTLLVSTGQAGANNHPAILRALAASGRSLQVIFLCAHRDDTRRELEHLAAAHPALNVRALGPADPARMAALKHLASAVVARPGTGATSEAIQLGAPLIHNGIGGVMPQELITVQYCKQHQCALLARNPAEIATAALRLKNEPGLADAMRTRLAAARPSGRPEDIVRWIAHLS